MADDSQDQLAEAAPTDGSPWFRTQMTPLRRWVFSTASIAALVLFMQAGYLRGLQYRTRDTTSAPFEKLLPLDDDPSSKPASSNPSSESRFGITGWAEATDLVDEFQGEQVAFRRWHLNLQVRNKSEFFVTLGNRLLLFEADNAGDFDGVGVHLSADREGKGVRSVPPPQAIEACGLTSYRVEHRDGSVDLRRGPLFPLDEDSEDHAGGDGFGHIRAGDSIAIAVSLDQGCSVAGAQPKVTLVFPNARVATANGELQQAVLVELQRTRAGSTRWTAGPSRTIPHEYAPLETMLKSAELSTVERVLAANLLADLAFDEAIVTVFKHACDGQKSGKLLLSALQILSNSQIDGFGERAISLLSDGTTSEDVRALAADYLGRIGDRSALRALEAAVDSTSDLVAERALTAASAISEETARQHLKKALQNSSRPNLQARAAEILVSKKLASIRPDLENLADNGSLSALEVLADCGYAESFPWLLKKLAAEKRMKWRATCIRGLWNSGDVMAVPTLLDVLAQESSLPGREDSAVVANLLCEHTPPSAAARVARLARNGNQLALVVASAMFASPELEVVLAILRAVEKEPAAVFRGNVEALASELSPEELRQAAKLALAALPMDEEPQKSAAELSEESNAQSRQ